MARRAGRAGFSNAAARLWASYNRAESAREKGRVGRRGRAAGGGQAGRRPGRPRPWVGQGGAAGRPRRGVICDSAALGRRFPDRRLLPARRPLGSARARPSSASGACAEPVAPGAAARNANARPVRLSTGRLARRAAHTSQSARRRVRPVTRAGGAPAAPGRAILQPLAAEDEWWGARLARLTLVLFWQLVALPPLVFCVYLPRADADVEREPEPVGSRAVPTIGASSSRSSGDRRRQRREPRRATMEETLLLVTDAPVAHGKPLASGSTSASSSPPAQPPSPCTPGSTPEHSPSALKSRQVEPLRPEATDENKQTQTRASADSRPVPAPAPVPGPPSRESLDMRRQSFSAMAADSRALMRRRSHDLTAMPRHTPPPEGVADVSAALGSMDVAAIGSSSSSGSGSLHGHLQHLRVYGRTNPVVGPTASPTLVPVGGVGGPGAGPPVRESHVEGEPLVAVEAPAAEAVWTRGRPVRIEWKVLDASVPALSIELLEDGSAATTVIARDAPNCGAFTYARVPWGMASGSRYFLKISAASSATLTTSVSMATAATAAALVSSSARYTTTGFFTISSAP